MFREPVSKSNRPIIMNAVEYVVFPGVVNKETRFVFMKEDMFITIVFPSERGYWRK